MGISSRCRWPANRASALEAGQAAPGAKQCVLQRVLGVLNRAKHPVAEGVELAAVGFELISRDRVRVRTGLSHHRSPA
jgi:hypothetical protein